MSLGSIVSSRSQKLYMQLLFVIIITVKRLKIAAIRSTNLCIISIFYRLVNRIERISFAGRLLK